MRVPLLFLETARKNSAEQLDSGKTCLRGTTSGLSCLFCLMSAAEGQFGIAPAKAEYFATSTATVIRGL